LLSEHRLFESKLILHIVINICCSYKKKIALDKILIFLEVQNKHLNKHLNKPGAIIKNSIGKLAMPRTPLSLVEEGNVNFATSALLNR
jgi:hypothetical protein